MAANQHDRDQGGDPRHRFTLAERTLASQTVVSAAADKKDTTRAREGQAREEERGSARPAESFHIAPMVPRGKLISLHASDNQRWRHGRAAALHGKR
jgi:hypothetical protein